MSLPYRGQDLHQVQFYKIQKCSLLGEKKRAKDRLKDFQYPIYLYKTFCRQIDMATDEYELDRIFIDIRRKYL